MRTWTMVAALAAFGVGALGAQESDSVAAPERQMQPRPGRMAQMVPRMQARQLRPELGPRGMGYDAQRMGRGMMTGGMMAGQGGIGVSRLLAARRQLELTDDQVSRLEALQTDLSAGREAAASRAGEIQRQLQEEWDKDQPDPEAIRRHALALGDIARTHQADAMAAAASARGLLTERQRGQLQGWAQAGRALRSRPMRGARPRMGVRRPGGGPFMRRPA
ncbi:MAG TPA: hypothetical protein VGA22_10340 [Gemmatimonadales bacterium]